MEHLSTRAFILHLGGTLVGCAGLRAGALELLRGLRMRGIRSALIDDVQGSPEIDVGGLVDLVVSQDQGGGPEAAVSVAVRRLQLPAWAVVAVGHTPAQMQAAARVGMVGYAVLTGVHHEQKLLAAGASRVYLNLAAMADDLDRTLAPQAAALSVWMPA